MDLPIASAKKVKALLVAYCIYTIWFFWWRALKQRSPKL